MTPRWPWTCAPLLVAVLAGCGSDTKAAPSRETGAVVRNIKTFDECLQRAGAVKVRSAAQLGFLQGVEGPGHQTADGSYTPNDVTNSAVNIGRPRSLVAFVPTRVRKDWSIYAYAETDAPQDAFQPDYEQIFRRAITAPQKLLSVLVLRTPPSAQPTRPTRAAMQCVLRQTP